MDEEGSVTYNAVLSRYTVKILDQNKATTATLTLAGTLLVPSLF